MMVRHNELQTAFFDMMEILDMYRDGWIITVFPDHDPRVDSAAFVHDGSETPPTMYMSDSLYALYCYSIGTENTNVRPGKGAE